MIFLTIGTQLTFDRLVVAMDEWVGNNPEVEVFAQIGNTSFQPKHMKYEKYIKPQEFNNLMTQADIIVSHAGMGTIISSLLAKKPVVVMARNSDLGEHRNQHQQATARKFSLLDGCYGCYEKNELFSLLNERDSFNAGEINKKNDLLSKEIEQRLQVLIKS